MGVEHNNGSHKVGVLLGILLLPTCCFAHGEQILVLPFCNAIAFVTFIIFIALWRAGGLMKLCAFGAFTLGVVLSWVLPLMPHTIAELAGCSFIHVFLVGFGVPVATVAVGCLIFRVFGYYWKLDTAIEQTKS